MIRRFMRTLIASLCLLGAPLVAQAQVPSTFGPYNIDLGAVVTLAAAATGVASPAQTNLTHRGLACLVNITALTGTSPTLTVAVQYKDAASGVWTSLLTSAALNATGSTLLMLYPGTTAASNTDVSSPLPRTWRINPTIGGTTPAVTGTVGCNYLN